MPVYEYRCADCNSKFDVFHKSFASEEEVKCPKCSSKNSKKLFSAFSASMDGSGNFSESYSGGSDPSCSTCGCGGGACGID